MPKIGLSVCIYIARSPAVGAFLFRGALAVFPLIVFLGTAPFSAALTDSADNFFAAACWTLLFSFLCHIRLLGFAIYG